MSPRELASHLIEARQEDQYAYGLYLVLSRLDPACPDHWLLTCDGYMVEPLRHTWVCVLERLIRCVGREALAGRLRLEGAGGPDE